MRNSAPAASACRYASRHRRRSSACTNPAIASGFGIPAASDSPNIRKAPVLQLNSRVRRSNDQIPRPASCSTSSGTTAAGNVAVSSGPTARAARRRCGASTADQTSVVSRTTAAARASTPHCRRPTLAIVMPMPRIAARTAAVAKAEIRHWEIRGRGRPSGRKTLRKSRSCDLRDLSAGSTQRSGMSVSFAMSRERGAKSGESCLRGRILHALRKWRTAWNAAFLCSCMSWPAGTPGPAATVAEAMGARRGICHVCSE